MGEFEDAIARAVITTFLALPAKSKPKPRPNSTEWVPLSGVVLEKTAGEMMCVALGTGMKCLPHIKIGLAAGMVLHDCHAEVLAIRAFNIFLVEECRKIASDSSYTSRYVRRRSAEEITLDSPQPFTIQEQVRVHFYSSEAPCGDGSMELTMASQEDATPWAPVSPPTDPVLRGRGYFSNLGVVRTKPGRADSQSTLSKSCSDKLALRQAVSTLLSPVSLLVAPANAYIASFILNQREHSEVACRRSFGAEGRMAGVKGCDWGGGYAFRPFRVRTTGVEFPFSKRAAVGKVEGKAVGKAVGCNVSAVWVRNRGAETLIGGVLQGRKQFVGIKGASMVCKVRVWKMVGEVAMLAGLEAVQRAVAVKTYEKLKQARNMVSRNKAKEEVRKVLGGWVRNGGGDFGMVE